MRAWLASQSRARTCAAFHSPRKLERENRRHARADDVPARQVGIPVQAGLEVVSLLFTIPAD